MYAQYLRGQGFEVVEARNGAEAIELVPAIHPALVVLDVGMPVLDGWKVTDRLRRNPTTKRMAIIILTAHVISGEAERARKLGATSYLTKPCLPEDLAYEIQRVLGLDRPAPALRRRPARGRARPRSPQRRRK